MNTFREYDDENNPETAVDLLETDIKGVRLQAVYGEVGKLYNQSRQAEAEAKLKEYAEWLAGFTLKDPAFVDVVKTFSVRFGRNRRREEELQASGVRPVTRFYIPDLDEQNAGRNLRGQLSCILAFTGVGKSHMAKYIGIRANVDDGLLVLHFQLEGSEEEVLNAYSGGLIARNAFYFERGCISELEICRFEKEIEPLCREHYRKVVSPVCGKHIDHRHPKRNCRIPQNQLPNTRHRHYRLDGPLERRLATTMERRARAVETHHRSQ